MVTLLGASPEGESGRAVGGLFLTVPWSCRTPQASRGRVGALEEGCCPSCHSGPPACQALEEGGAGYDGIHGVGAVLCFNSLSLRTASLLPLLLELAQTSGCGQGGGNASGSFFAPSCPSYPRARGFDLALRLGAQTSKGCQHPCSGHEDMGTKARRVRDQEALSGRGREIAFHPPSLTPSSHPCARPCHGADPGTSAPCGMCHPRALPRNGPPLAPADPPRPQTAGFPGAPSPAGGSAGRRLMPGSHGGWLPEEGKNKEGGGGD